MWITYITVLITKEIFHRKITLMTFILKVIAAYAYVKRQTFVCISV